MRLDAAYLEQQAERCLARADECDKQARGNLAVFTGRHVVWYAESAAWRGEAELWRDAAAAVQNAAVSDMRLKDAVRSSMANVAESAGLREQVEQARQARQVIRETLLPDAARQAVLAERRCRAHAIFERAGVRG